MIPDGIETMISLFIKKNILESLTDTKFIIVSAIFLFFMIQGAIFFAIDYPVSRQNYRNLNKLAEDNVNLERAVIIKKPNKLAFIHGKEDDYLPKYLIVITT